MYYRLSIALLLHSLTFSSLTANTPLSLSTQEILLFGSTAEQGYDEGFIELVEMIYGEGFLSQGGSRSIDEMFDGVNLDEMKALDLGSGLGMYDIHLATNHNMQIIGIDPQAIMARKAK